MIRVGILSMQRIANYGSFLQAYGLKRMLEELGCEVEFVDYHAGECLVHNDCSKGAARKLSKVMEIMKLKAPIKEKIRFIQYKRNYAKKYYPYLEINERENYTPELDLLVIGSDEVFNCVQDNTNVGFSPELFGEGNRAQRLITYAASFGNTTISDLEKYKVKEKVSQWLKRFDALSVRDKNSGNIVKELTGILPEYHPDPVLAYDFVGRCKQIPASVPESDYMILYGYSGRFTTEECREIRAYANKNGWKVFCIGGVQQCCDRYVDCNPFQVITYFQQAACIVTDTFHGTILSVITQQKFVSFVRSSGYGNAEKLTDILDRLCLQERRIENLDRLEEMLSTTIDYAKTNDIIHAERERVREYLKKELEQCTRN